jgi:hypothetical protein
VTLNLTPLMKPYVFSPGMAYSLFVSALLWHSMPCMYADCPRIVQCCMPCMPCVYADCSFIVHCCKPCLQGLSALGYAAGLSPEPQRHLARACRSPPLRAPGLVPPRRGDGHPIVACEVRLLPACDANACVSALEPSA